MVTGEVVICMNSPFDRTPEHGNRKTGLRSAFILLVFAAVAAAACLAQQDAPAAAPSTPPAQATTSSSPAAADKKPDATPDNLAGNATAKTPDPVANETPEQRRQDAQIQARKNQLAVDTAKLLQLANELKAEMDKSSKDTLSVNVIKKADQVEKLAHKVRDEMKANLGN